MHHAFAMLQGGGQGLAQGGFVLGRHHQAGHGQLNGVLFEAVNARETGGRQKVSVYPQVGVATGSCPVGQFGVHAFAVHHQGAEQANVLAFEFTHQLRRNAVWRLRLHRRAIVRAMLGAEFDKQQTQKVPHLGGGAHGGFAPATRQALLNRHRGWNAVHRIHLGASCGLHDAARIRVEAFQIASLTFVEQDVKRQRGLTRARHAGDDVELATRDVDAQALEVVLFGVDDLNAALIRR